LSGGLNLSRGLNRFKPALNLNWVLADLNRGSNSLNSVSGSRISHSKVFSSDQIMTSNPEGENMSASIDLIVIAFILEFRGLDKLTVLY